MLRMMLPKLSAYKRNLDETKYVFFFLIKDDQLLEIYNEIWDNLNNSVNKRSDIKPICNEKY